MSLKNWWTGDVVTSSFFLRPSSKSEDTIALKATDISGADIRMKLRRDDNEEGKISGLNSKGA